MKDDISSERYWLVCIALSICVIGGIMLLTHYVLTGTTLLLIGLAGIVR